MALVQREQASQSGSSGSVHRATHGHLHRFQIQPSALVTVQQDYPYQSAYFAGDFLLDAFGRFFPSGDELASAIGRKRQIRVLTSTNCWLSCWKVRNSATSRSALLRADGLGRDSVMDLPSSL